MAPAFSAELEQGRDIYTFLKEKVDCPIYYQRRLSARESNLQRDPKTGVPKYFILPYPYSYDRQLACLHEYGHYLDKRPETEPNHCYVLTKPKAIKNSAAVRRHFTQAEITAWANAVTTIFANEWKIPQDTYVDLIANFGLRTYYDTWAKNGGLQPDLREDFDDLFAFIDLFVSPGFQKVPSIQNYYI